MDRVIKARLIRFELEQADIKLSETSVKDLESIQLIKNIILALSNFSEFELTIRPLYCNYKFLSEKHNQSKKYIAFFKYLRNKFVGHIKTELINKSIEWRPEFGFLLKESDDKEIIFMFNIWILETAINSYVNKDGSHKIFQTETNLEYPEDSQRFTSLLRFCLNNIVDYLKQLESVLLEIIDLSEYESDNIIVWKKAAKTDFNFIKK